MSSVKHTTGFDVAQPVDVLFPLFSAEGEKHWVPGWDYENVMGTTDLHEDYVFVTRSHDHAAADAIWIVKRYEPESHHVAFYRVEPEVKVGVVTVRLTARGRESTHVEVSYEYIALSEKGEDFLATFTEDFYRGFIGEWEELLNRYFAAQGGRR